MQMQVAGLTLIEGGRIGRLVVALATAIALLAVLPAAPAGAQAGLTVDLRVLVIAGDATIDPGLPLIEEVLVEAGVAHTILDSNTQDLTAEMLFDGSRGFYNGIILTDAELFVPPDTSGFTVPEWELLQEYERTFGVREAVMSGSPTDVSSALDYGLDEVFSGSGIVADWVGPAGTDVFRYVNTDAQLTISDFAVASQPTGSGPAVTPVLVDSNAPDNVLISILDYDDGRQVLFSSIASASFLVHSRVLAYEFVRFATSGVHLGAHRHFLSVHVDDLFLGSAVWNTEGRFSDSSEPYRNTVPDIDAVLAGQADINGRYGELVDDLRWELAFNGLGSPVTSVGDLRIEADAVVAEALPGRRYGRSGDLRFGRTSRGERVALYRFEASPPPAEVGTVLRLTRDDTGPVRGRVCAVTQAWDEAQVTWAEAQPGTPWEAELGGPTIDEGSCITFDLERSSDPIEIKPLLDRWLDGDENNGVATFIEGRSLTTPSRESGAGAVLHHGTAPTLPDDLTDRVLATADDLAFLNHTFTHRDLDVSNGTGRDEAFFEISRNIQAWTQLVLPGLDVNRQTLVTGQHSGLSEDQGTFFDTSDDIFFPDGANPGLLDAMESLGIRYVAGDQSRPNQGAQQFLPDRDIILLPRYPANVFFDVRFPDEMVAEYNFLFHENYLDQGLDPCVEPGARCEPVDYDVIVRDEAQLALLRLLSGKAWPHYFHITNLADYDGQGSTLLGDWIEALLDAYATLLTLPIESPRFHEIGTRAEERLTMMQSDLVATLDIASGEVTLSAGTDVSFEVTGLVGGTEHGGVLVQHVSVTGGSPLTMNVAADGAHANAEATASSTVAALTPDRIGVDTDRVIIAGAPAPSHGVVAFDVPTDSGAIVAATLTLRDPWVGGPPMSAEICRADDIAIDTVTWADGTTEAIASEDCVAVELRHGESTTVDVSAFAEEWVATGSATLVVRTASGTASFGSAGGTDAPTLVVTTAR